MHNHNGCGNMVRFSKDKADMFAVAVKNIEAARPLVIEKFYILLNVCVQTWKPLKRILGFKTQQYKNYLKLKDLTYDQLKEKLDKECRLEVGRYIFTKCRLREYGENFKEEYVKKFTRLYEMRNDVEDYYLTQEDMNVLLFWQTPIPANYDWREYWHPILDHW